MSKKTELKSLQDKLEKLLVKAAEIQEQLAERFYYYRSELVEGVLVTPKAKRLLDDAVDRQQENYPACVQFTADDGPEDVQTVEGLIELSYGIPIQVLQRREGTLLSLGRKASYQAGTFILMLQ